MKNKTLLILAAGMGSRFGGLKQMEPFGPNGEFIIDYSVYDAVRCGFNKIVFIIKDEISNQFKETIGKRISRSLKNKNIKIEYAYQNLDNIPDGYKIPKERIKPLGTAHAVLCAKKYINEPFVMINSDDFYGYEAYLEASNYINSNNNDETGVVGYKVVNTIPKVGAVKRGICDYIDGKLLSLTESSIEKENNTIKATPLGTTDTRIIHDNTLVSMNMLIFYPSIFKKIENKFIEFLENNDLTKDEFLIPDIITSDIKENKANVNVIETKSKWVGVTYKEDKISVENYIDTLIKKNIYPNNLWN